VTYLLFSDYAVEPNNLSGLTGEGTGNDQLSIDLIDGAAAVCYVTSEELRYMMAQSWDVVGIFTVRLVGLCDTTMYIIFFQSKFCSLMQRPIELRAFQYFGVVVMLPSLRSTKVGIKSYGSALVKVRWNFSDQALWIGAGLTKL
jgi:hypothetical protein